MLSFLANLGSGLKSLGAGFARGAVSAGKGIGRGFRRIGELGEGAYDLGPGGTPPFVPDGGRRPSYWGMEPRDPSYSGALQNLASGSPTRVIEDAVAGAENDARPAFAPIRLPGGHDLPDLPISRRDLPIPALTPAPPMSELRSPLPSLPTRRARMPVEAPAIAPVAAGVEALAPEMDLDRRNLPIPRLPGHAGGPIPFNPIDAAKYDSVMSHAKRDAAGDLIPKAEGGGFKRDLGTTLRNAFLGASAAARSARPDEDPLGRAIGGALSAGAGSAINPQAGYEFAFDFGERPKLEAEMERARAERDRARAERMADLDVTIKEGQVARIPREEENERAKLEILRDAERRQLLVAQSQIALNLAREEAARTGVPKEVDIENPDTGQIETVMVYPNGRREVVGASGKAAIARRREDEAMKRTRVQESGATGRTAMTTASAEKRAQMRIDADREGAEGGESTLRKPGSQGGKTATMSRLREFYKAKGVTDDAEIRRRAKEHGFTVKD